jgi:formate hydrogenlyase subunit 4
MTALFLLLLAPLFTGSLKWLKARLQHRQGPIVFIDYLNLGKLLRKIYVLPQLASPVFILGPLLSALGPLLAAALLPILPSLSFAGDFLLVVGLLNLGRFSRALAALDTGSPFGGQGSYREGFVALLTEPGTLLALTAVALTSKNFSLATLPNPSAQTSIAIILAVAALALALLAEGARVPIDDPSTHLELTMIHEAQLLDHSGPLLALYELASALKLLVYVALIALLLPFNTLLSFFLVALIAWLGLAYLETYSMRIKYSRLPDLMIYNTAAGALALLGMVLRVKL